ncbi:MAG: site-specific DNA-methyltransferase [Verrucomicrobiota bacterium]
MSAFTLHVGDCREVMRSMPESSVQCCVTSPPYFGLRDYGVSGQIGQEESPEAFVEIMVDVFREVRRVLRPDGTCWMNLGDSYAGAAGGFQGQTGQRASRTFTARTKGSLIPGGLAAKQLMGMPWRVALALQADGWWLRQDIIWSKPNPMPESVTDRCAKAHEYIFLLTKSPNYYFDQSSIAEPCSPNTHSRISQNLEAQLGSERANGGAKTNGRMKAVFKKGKTGAESGGSKNNPSFAAGTCLRVDSRNKRSVWTVPSAPYKEAHFATYPPDLIKPCILAGSRPGDVVLDPFGGSGTTGEVAIELGRRAVLIELNPKYAELIRRRTSITPGLAL